MQGLRFKKTLYPLNDRLKPAVLLLIFVVTFFTLMALQTRLARALTAGPRTATAIGDCVVDASIGTVGWTNPGNAYSSADGGLAATATIGKSEISQYVRCSNFGFTTAMIPSGSTISGIVVGVARSTSAASLGADNAVRLVKGGVIGATDRSTLTSWPTTMTNEDHGGSTDLWGATWAVADITASNFGAAVSAKNTTSGKGATGTFSIDYIQITVHYTPPSTFEQAAYRWFNNLDSKDLNGIQSASTSESRIWDMAIDSSAGHVYTAGYDTEGGNNQWRVEKRNVSDGSLVTGFGTNGILQINPSTGHERIRTIALDAASGRFFIASYDNSPGNTQLNLQKRTMATGALCTAAACGTEFGTGGIITNNVSAGTDVYETIVVDGTNGYLYLGGYDSTPTDNQWRWEKRKTTTGALCTALECSTEFGTGGVLVNNPSTGGDIHYNMTVDITGGYIYSIGQDAGTTNLQWRIEKRKASTGALCTAAECGTAFGTGGVITVNPSTGNDVPEDIEVDPSNGYIYIAGWDSAPGNMQWRIEKRKATSGALCTALECGTEFGTGGVFTNNPSASNEAIVSMEINPTAGYMVAAGDDQVNGNYQLRLEKRLLSSAALCTAAACGTEFGTGGVVTSNPSVGEDVIRDIALDSTHIYVGGHDTVTAANQWRMEKYNLTSGANGWGRPMAAQNSATTLTSAGQAFRLRSLLYVGTTNLAQNGQQFKLQFAGKGAGTCALPSGTPSTYTDIVVAGKSWKQETAAAAWSSRSGAAVVTFNNKLWIMGGFDGSLNTSLNDVWSSPDGITWTRETASAAWSPRNGHKAAVFNNKIWIVGSSSDTWSSSDGINWTQETITNGWTVTGSHGVLAYNNKFWVMGGWNGTSYSNEVWSSSDGNNWTRVTAAAGWSARGVSTAVVFNNKMWIIGTGSNSDTWSSSDGITWTQEATTVPWGTRTIGSVAAYDSKIWAMGGNSGATDYNDVWSTGDGINWTQETASAPWSARYNIRSTVLGSKLFIVGGEYGSAGSLNDVWSLSQTSSPFVYSDNPTPANASTVSANANDPTNGVTPIVNQTYIESGNFTNSVAAIPSGQNGLWDFVLKDNGAPAGSTYCFRVVKSDGSLLNTYTTYPEITSYSGVTNTAPAAPASLAQAKVTGGASVATGGWTNESQIRLSASATDPDASDTLQLCVERQPLGTAFTGTGEVCGTGVAYSGTAVTVSADLTGLSEGQYHWQARVKDAAGAYSGWVSYGANLETARDFGVDTTAPTGTVYDGSTANVDAAFNDGSLTSLSGNWSVNSDISGLAGYEYAIGTTAGGTGIRTWTSVGTGTSVTASSLTLNTSEPYYLSVRTTDNAGNVSTISSNGQLVAPTLGFSLSSSTITFSAVNAGNSYTATSNVSLTVTTNAKNGYQVRAAATQDLTDAASRVIGMFSGGTYESPAAWGSNTGFGYTSSDTLVGGTNRFNSATCPGGGSAPCYAPYSKTLPGDVVADSTAPVTAGDTHTITSRITVAPEQAAGKYETVITYSATAWY